MKAYLEWDGEKWAGIILKPEAPEDEEVLAKLGADILRQPVEFARNREVKMPRPMTVTIVSEPQIAQGEVEHGR